MKEMIENRIERLRELMEREKIDAFIIPSSDAHNGEYIADHWKSREWISGFTGSAGTAVVTLTESVSDEFLKKAVEDQDYKVLEIR